jgi:hypothetical protein
MQADELARRAGETPQRRRYREALTLWNSRSDSPLATSVFASSVPTYR